MAEQADQLETVTSSTTLKDLQSLYDLGDEASQSTVLVEPKKTPPRDPESGQFLPKPEHNKFLVQAARQLDISDEEIAKLDPQQLRAYIDDARRAQSAQQRDGTVQGALDDAQKRAAAARQARFETDELQRNQADEANADPLPGIKEEDYTPEYRNVFTAIRSLHKEVQELKQFKQQALQTLSAQNNEATASFARKVDSQLALLGPEYEPFIGRGRGHKLAPNSLERQVRNQLIQDAAAIAGEGATKEDVIESIRAAAQKRFGRLVGASEEPERPRKYPARQAQANGVHPQFRVPHADEDGELLSDEQIAWLNAGVRKPTNRLGAAEPKGKEKAINGVTQRIREIRDSGGSQEDGYETTPDDFLS